jgi:hypothetical protein
MTRPPPALSVVAVFHEMRREAARTLVTLDIPYQRGIAATDFEVIAVDNGSAAPLRPDDVAAACARARLVLEPAGDPSPCAAINRAVAAAPGEYVMVCIDGARMLSPGVLREALAALRAHAHPFVYTLGMHLGPKPQNESMLEGYDQAAEDALLAGVPWREDGYRLFDVASLAYSSREGYFGQLSESNCFALRRDDFLALGGMDEAFASPGGGLVNLDFFNRAHGLPGVRPVMLLGEATFHQFHGGVATNVPRAEHPWARMAAEYEAIRGKPYANEAGPPDFAGSLSPRYHAALMPAAPDR